MNAKSLKGAKLDENFFKSLEVINKNNGGLQGYESLKNKVQNERNDVSGILAQIDGKVTQTKKEDQEFLSKLKSSNNSQFVDYVSFDGANQDLIANIIGNFFF